MSNKDHYIEVIHLDKFKVKTIFDEKRQKPIVPIYVTSVIDIPSRNTKRLKKIKIGEAHLLRIEPDTISFRITLSAEISIPGINKERTLQIEDLKLCDFRTYTIRGLFPEDPPNTVVIKHFDVIEIYPENK